MKVTPRGKTLLRVIWMVSLLAVIAGSLLPDNSPPIQLLGLLHLGDKVLHFAAYALLAFLPALHEPWQNIAGVAALLVLLGVLLEFGQLLSPGRSFEMGDMMADGTGVCMGLLAGWPLRG